MSANKNTRGFTIVELLIVIVVIAILAAVTIVAYNGISNRAKASAAQSGASQAAKKLLSYAVQNNDAYPASTVGDPANIDTLTSLGITNGSTTYQYSSNNTVVPRTFCVTATTQSVSYYQNNTTQTTPAAGVCPGHGASGAVLATNQFKNPFFVGPFTLVSYANMINPQLVIVGGVRYLQMEATSTGASAMRINSFEDRWAIGEGQQVYVRATIRNPNASNKTFSLALRFYDAAGSTQGSVLSGSYSSSTIGIPAGDTAVISYNTVAPAGTASVLVTPSRNSSNAAIGDLTQVTGVWLGSVDSAAASGDTAGWAWNGPANASTSTGPVQ